MDCWLIHDCGDEMGKQKKTSASMNKELKQWVQESKSSKTTKKPSKKYQKKPKGNCHICGEKPAKAFCIKCGKAVCSECFFHIVSLCKKCISKKTADKWKQKKHNWEKTLGVDWVKD